MNTAQLEQLSNAASIASCQGCPGMRFHTSSQGVIPALSSRRAISATNGLSTLLWDKKTSMVPLSGVEVEACVISKARREHHSLVNSAGLSQNNMMAATSARKPAASLGYSRILR